MKIEQSNREVRHELGSRVRIREGKQRTNRDLANSAQPPPPPSRKAGSGREEVEGNEEERARVARGGLERRSGTRRVELGPRPVARAEEWPGGRPARGGEASSGRGARSGQGARHDQLRLRGVAASGAQPAAAGSGRGGMSGGGSLARGGRQARRRGAKGLPRPAGAGLGKSAARPWRSGAHGGAVWREEGDGCTRKKKDEVFVVLLGHSPA